MRGYSDPESFAAHRTPARRRDVAGVRRSLKRHPDRLRDDLQSDASTVSVPGGDRVPVQGSGTVEAADRHHYRVAGAAFSEIDSGFREGSHRADSLLSRHYAARHHSFYQGPSLFDFEGVEVLPKPDEVAARSDDGPFASTQPRASGGQHGPYRFDPVRAGQFADAGGAHDGLNRAARNHPRPRR